MKLEIDDDTSLEILAHWCCSLIAMSGDAWADVEDTTLETFYVAHEAQDEASPLARALAHAAEYRRTNASNSARVGRLINAWPHLPRTLPVWR